MKCLNTMKIPEKHLIFLKNKAFAGENNMPHFEVEYQNHKPSYQVVRVYPYCLKSYPDCTNIYLYDWDVYAKFVVEVPYFDIPWKDPEKLIKKLSTYTLLS